MSKVFASGLLQGEVALVTGASRGIGAAIARALANAGAIVVGTATSPGGASTITDTLGDSGRGLVLDISDDTSVQAAIESIQNKEGAPTILVNNAGITRDNLLMRMKPEEWNDVLETNLSGTFRMSKACLRGMMKAKKGRIISIASVIGIMGNAGQANYAASKAGLIGLTKSVAKELAKRNITCNCIAPGFIDTEMTGVLSDKIKEQARQIIPLGRMGRAEEVAFAATFLASEQASYITGQVLIVDGGLRM